MDPCPFVRIRVGNLALKLPNPQPPPVVLYHCKIKLSNFPLQIATVPASPPDSNSAPSSASASSAACFCFSKSDVHAFLLLAKKKKKKPGLSLTIDVYGDSNNESRRCGLGFGSGKFVGRVSLALDLGDDGTPSGLMHNGWVRLGKGNANNRSGSELYVSVKSDPDPRFVFEFDAQPECSPQVFQVQGSIKQPVFTCKFGFRNSGDRNRNLRCSSTASEPSTSTSCWGANGHRGRGSHGSKERKGWTVTIHDLSGSPVAVASMVTPFVPSPGSDRVSRSNPGAWLILRPADGTWKPWGRLEAWSDRSSDVSHRFEILSASGGVTLATGDVSASSGGKFTIDTTAAYYNSPISSPNGSFDLGSWSGSGSASASASGSGSGSGSECGSGWCGPQWMYKGFVMSSTVGGEKARVEVGVQHVNCTEDAAVFVALAAAADLSVDACRPFSQKLRKELRQPSEEEVVV